MVTPIYGPRQCLAAAKRVFILSSIQCSARQGEDKGSKIEGHSTSRTYEETMAKAQEICKGGNLLCLDQVEIPTQVSDGEITGWRSVTAPTELFQTLLAQNLTHFAQAKDTPFVAGTLGQQLHPFAQDQFSESILHGTVDLSNLHLSASMHDCIHEMCFPPGEDGSGPVSNVISPEDFSNGFKLISEDLS
jgi:hypothetical protein